MNTLKIKIEDNKTVSLSSGHKKVMLQEIINNANAGELVNILNNIFQKVKLDYIDIAKQVNSSFREFRHTYENAEVLYIIDMGVDSLTKLQSYRGISYPPLAINDLNQNEFEINSVEVYCHGEVTLLEVLSNANIKLEELK